MKEIWKEIIGYEGLYSVSNTGLVKRVTTNKIKYPSLNSWGYKVVSLSKSNTKLKTVLVHRLVAIHFIDNPENKKQVNHIDGIKTNNNVSNLEWKTRHENMTHAFKTGLNSNPVREKHNRAILTEEMYLKCVELRKQKLTYAKIVEYIFDTYKIKVGRTTINAALTGQTWKQNIKENLRSYEKRKSPKC